MDAFEALYRQHAPRLYALARRMAGPAAADDLLQDIFVHAYRKLDTFKGDAAIGTWLYRLAVNRCVDHIRSRHERMARATSGLDDVAHEPEAPAAGEALRLDLARAVEQLPAGCREVFVLHDVEGFEHKEIAAMLGIAEGTSKSQVSKARAKLRVLLA